MINALIEHRQGKDRLVDIPESLPGVPDESCVERRDVPLPSPSGSGSDTPPSGSDTCVDASSLCGPSAALGAPPSGGTSTAPLGSPPSGGPSTSATFGSPPSSPATATRCYVSLCASPHADTCSVLSPGHLPHNDGSLRSPPPPPRSPTPPTAPRSPTPPPQVVSPLQRELGARSRRCPICLVS